MEMFIKRFLQKRIQKKSSFGLIPRSNLPRQLEIYNFGADGIEKSYVATFSNWREDPKLPAKLFEFSPPENAVESEILKKK